MDKVMDVLKMIILSPEMGVALSIAIINKLTESVGRIAFSLLSSDQRWAISIVILIPITLLIACYKLGAEVLSPKGKRKILLEWPGYWRLKYRVIFSLIICIVSLIASILGFFLIMDKRSNGAAMLIIGAW